jgi:hypothetical protein
MLVFSNKCGQLGNRILAFAHLIAAAKTHKWLVLNLSFDEYSRFFLGTHDDIYCRYPKVTGVIKSDRLRSVFFIFIKAVLKVLRKAGLLHSPVHGIVVADLPEYQFDRPSYYNLSNLELVALMKSKSVVFLFGRFFRSYDNLEKHQGAVRQHFRLLPGIEDRIHQRFENIQEGADTVVGVHLRRGDYREFAEGRYFYSQQDYANKLRELVASSPARKLSFVLCSNEPIELVHFEGLNVTRGPGHEIEDMYLLAKCDYIVGPPSTYSQWASFYGKKPLLQLTTIDKPIDFQQFKLLPVKTLCNFSFN